MKALVSQDKIQVRAIEKCDNVTCLIVDCLNYEAYKGLPDLVEYDSQTFGLTGWNSDRHYACYRNDATWAKRIK
jgi:hypothetical protein